ncbi:MAG: PaaI family thioesterase [Pseudolabrys sp.]|nr:PaaI family thioesterase [Pseudolabrys sp.]
MIEDAFNQPAYAHFLGIKIVDVSADRLTAEMVVTEQHANRNGVLHGGALMSLADNLGGTAATANLASGQATTTIESKTNFFASIAVGDTAFAECTPLHRGNKTMVWQTRVTRGDGKLAAVVTQTQMILEKRSR